MSTSTTTASIPMRTKCPTGYQMLIRHFFFFRRESHSILFPPICPRAQVVSSTYSSFSLLGAWYIWLFYNRRFFESTFYFDFRCGILHARGIPPTAKIPSSDIDEYITSKWNDEIGVFYWGKEQLVLRGAIESWPILYGWLKGSVAGAGGCSV